MFTGHRDQFFGHISYSQHGEDMFLVNAFRLIGIDRGRYLDVGAHHPINCSNTALLNSLGWNGVNVEANPNLVSAFRELRPKDVTINAAVWPYARYNISLFMYDDLSGRNSCNKSFMESDGFSPIKEIEVPAVTIDSIIEKHFSGIFPEFMSIDIEGIDLEVLKSCSWTAENCPLIVCCEVRKSSRSAAIELMSGKGFSSFCLFQENMIFVMSTIVDLLR